MLILILAVQVGPEQEMMIMSIKIVIYFGCLKCAERCKKFFMCIVPCIGPLLSKSSQLYLIPVVRRLQATLQVQLAEFCLRFWVQTSPFLLWNSVVHSMGHAGKYTGALTHA